MEQTAIFAGGCFWCVEHDLRTLPGVGSVVSGYAGEANGGQLVTYENHVGFREAVLVTYDDSIISFKKLCQFFLDHIDPTDAGGQFADRGESYKTAIYYKNKKEEEIARALLDELAESKIYGDKPIAVEVLPETSFQPAEEYHQEYAEKNPEHYAMYRRGSGREMFVGGVCKIREDKKINWKE